MANLLQMVKKMSKKVSGKKMDEKDHLIEEQGVVGSRKQSKKKVSKKLSSVSKKAASKRVKSKSSGYNFSAAEKKLGVVNQ